MKRIIDLFRKREESLEERARSLAHGTVHVPTYGDGTPAEDINKYLDWFFETTRDLDLYRTPDEAAIFASVLHALSNGGQLMHPAAYLLTNDENRGEKYRELDRTRRTTDGMENLLYWNLADLGRIPKIPVSPNDEYSVLKLRMREILGDYLRKTGGKLYKRSGTMLHWEKDEKCDMIQREVPDDILDYWKAVLLSDF